jgi:hypothetical protein
MQKNKKPRILFITFGEDSSHLQGLEIAAKRLHDQCIKADVFSKVIVLNRASVEEMPNFNLIKPLFSNESWGLGFFVWKPFILGWAFSEFEGQFDYIVYADAGCELQANKVRVKKLYSTLRRLENQPVLAHFSELPEILVTKKSVLDLLVDEADKFRGNVEATVIYLKMGKAAEKFVNEWLMLCTENNGSALKPIEDNDNNSLMLQFHRYDQSIFSVHYKNNFASFLTPIRPRIDISGKPLFVDEILLSFNILWPLRNRSEVSRLNPLINNVLVSEFAFTFFRLFRILKKVKQKIWMKKNSFNELSLLIHYREFGRMSTR